MKYFSFLLIIISTFFMVGCTEVQDAEIGDIEGLKVSNISGNSVTLEMLVPIHNPNSFRFKITNIDLDVEINGSVVGNISNNNKIVVPAKSYHKHKIKLDVKLKDALQGGAVIFNTLMGRSQKLTLKGFIKARAFVITKKIEVEKTKEISLFNK